MVLGILLFVGLLLLIPAFLLFHLWTRAQDQQTLRFILSYLESQQFDFAVDPELLSEDDDDLTF